MKKLLILVAAVLTIAPAIAQKDLYEQFTFSGGTNIFFAGHTNQLWFTAPEVPGMTISLKAEVGTITSLPEKGHYALDLPVNMPSSNTIFVIRDSAGVKKTVYSYGIMVAEAPQPSLFPLLAGAHGTISKEAILKNPVLTVVPFHDYLNLNWEKFKVSSFTMTINADGDLISKTTTGDRLNDDMLGMISKMEKGAKLYLENIEVLGNKGTKRNLTFLTVNID